MKMLKIKMHRTPWTKQELKALKKHSKAKTPMSKLVKEFGRTQGALRWRANQQGYGLGEKQWSRHSR